GRRKPTSPSWIARHTLAMPPRPAISTSSYCPRIRWPGVMGPEGTAARPPAQPWCAPPGPGRAVLWRPAPDASIIEGLGRMMGARRSVALGVALAILAGAEIRSARAETQAVRIESDPAGATI